MADQLLACPVHRDVLEISGPDAASYLQGQVSQDVETIAVATSTWTFVLHPDGKVAGWARMTRTAADRFVLDVDGGAGDELEARLRRFLLRTKADIARHDWPAVAVRAATDDELPHPELPDGVLRCRAVGPGVVGYDLLGPGAVAPDVATVVTPEAFDAERIAHGVPKAGAELTDATIPAEIGQWIIDESVSFTKGCYVGQELTARIDSRGGNVPRRLRVLTTAAPVAVGAPLEAAGPPATITSSAVSEVHGPVALAMVGRAVEVGATVGVGGVDAVVHDAPLG